MKSTTKKIKEHQKNVLKEILDSIVEGNELCPQQINRRWNCLDCRELFPNITLYYTPPCPCEIYEKRYLVRKIKKIIKGWDDNKGVEI